MTDNKGLILMVNHRLVPLAMLSVLIGASTWALATSGSEATPGGKLSARTAKASLGTQTAGQTFTYVYVLSNQGDQSVKVDQVTADVDWVSLKLYGPQGQVAISPDENTTDLTLAPKQNSRVYLEVDTTNLDGPQAGKIQLHNNGDPNIVELTFDMTVKPAATRKDAPAVTTEKNNQTPDPTPSGPLPRINFNEYEHNFGSMLSGEKQSCTFTVSNEGEGDLEITKVYASCGCLATTMRANDDEVSISELNTGRRVLSLVKGDTAEMDITLDTKGLRGPVNRKIRVYSNDNTKNPVYLSLKCSAEQAYKLEPRNLRFTPLMRREVVTRSLTFTPTKLDNCEILECVSPAEYVKVEWQKFDAAPGAVRTSPLYRIDVTITEDAPVGNIMKPIILKTSHEKIPELQIPMFARIMPEISFRSSSPNNPEKIEFGVIMKDGEVSKDLEITNANPAVPFEVTKIEILSRYKNHVKAEILELDAGTKYILRMTALESLDARYFQGVVRLTTNHPDLPSKDLAFHGWIKR